MKYLATFFLIAFFGFQATVVKAAVCACYDDANSCQEAFAEDENECRDNCEILLETNFSYQVFSNTYGDGPDGELTVSDDCTAAQELATAGATPATQTSPVTYLSPILNVNIPGVSFSKVLEDGNYIQVNFLGEYITGLYKYLLAISGIFAVLMLVVGGIQYVIAPGGSETSKAKTRITNALAGMVLLFCTFLILYTVNPELTVFEGLSIKKIPTIEFSFYEENLASCPDVANTVRACSAQTLTNPGGWSDEMVSLVNEFATSLKVDPILLGAHLKLESSGSATFGRRRGVCGEIGPAQFMPTTFEAIVGQPCCTNISRKRGLTGEDTGACDSTTPDWPPSFSFQCYSSICSNCQEAAESCIDYFDTAKPNGLRNSIEAQAKFVRNTLQRVNGDLALEMCAYNGSGKAAAEYAKTAAQAYSALCNSSGGTQ